MSLTYKIPKVQSMLVIFFLMSGKIFNGLKSQGLNYGNDVRNVSSSPKIYYDIVFICFEKMLWARRDITCIWVWPGELFSYALKCAPMYLRTLLEHIHKRNLTISWRFFSCYFYRSSSALHCQSSIIGPPSEGGSSKCPIFVHSSSGIENRTLGRPPPPPPSEGHK